MVVASSCLAFRALITPYFAKHLFAKQELITRARFRGQDFNQCHTKSFVFFSRESCFIKAIENFFPVFT